MNKRKPLSYKKRQKKNEKMKRDTLKLIRKYSVNQWLILIRKLNINSRELRHRPEFLTVATDMVIRIAKNKDNQLQVPLNNEATKLVQAEIELTDGPNNLIKLFGIGGISLFAVWQNRLNYIDTNILGRMPILYKNYNKELSSSIGISIEDIYVILLAMYRLKGKILFKKDMLISTDINSLSREKIDSFFLYFSKKTGEYIKEAKKEKIYENCFGKFKYLIRYPIVALDNEEYIIPVFEQLLDTVSNNLYFILLECFQTKGSKVSGSFQTEFGEVFESYILGFAKDVFGESNVIRAEEIVPGGKGNRCEAIAYHENKSLAIEVKKMNFKRDAISDKNKDYIDKVIETRLVKAFNQIENTMKYDKSDVCYGLIVIPDIMLSFASMIIYMKERFEGKAQFDKRIQICTLSQYESLMANDKDTVFEILDKAMHRDFKDGSDIIHVMTDMNSNGCDLYLKNKKLSDATNYILNSLEK